jgi:S1-C subfamily serine protease
MRCTTQPDSRVARHGSPSREHSIWPAAASLLIAVLLTATPAKADERDNGDAKPEVGCSRLDADIGNTRCPAFGAKAIPGDLSSAVKACVSLSCKDGHGTAVHLGNGYFITARHVAEEGKQWVLKGEDKRVIYAEVVWESVGTDLALLKVDAKRHKSGIIFPASQPACRDPLVGEKVTAVGNPAEIWFAHVSGYVTSGAQTTQGKTQFYRPQPLAHAAGDPHPSPSATPSPDTGEGEERAARQDIGYWKDAYVFDLPVFPGFSGGPVYSSDGSVLGLVVGILGDTSYSIVEPVAKICDLLPALERSE